MKRTLLIVLSVAALVGYKAFNDARHDVAGANQSRCAAYAANDLVCPYSQ
ncbi:hypothetical protein ACVXHM_17490 [Pseudomonas aeruginosa]|uniref:Uncharacterized protein n=1 Tax=Pseudomonas putida TaxID=303 RepID=A0A1L7NNI2_PSEPU|nr:MULTISPECIES: hypothetical protein [Pseudomonas]ELQ8317783.1 hypothetical protein [Pseudomonas aeruginosa]MBI6904514.1 hypothetical protein [Pseudomonas aeruginosa]MCR7872869.1 hypothetical protein [Pseudomonas aeruginosa]MCS7527198.1 hypothetical protein [Pseudomonas aeruginosa]MCS8510114.1 hypothetical protein [Pseudomonas aeruginosa]